MKAGYIFRRTAALLLTLLLLTCTMVGCGDEEELPQVTLRTMSIMGDDGVKETYTALLESYSAQYPNVYHMGTLADSGSAYKLNAIFEDTYTAAKYPHAVCYYTDSGMEDVYEHFVSLEEIRLTYPDFASGISKAVLDSVRAEDGKVYCIPFMGSWTALAVNDALLEQYGLAAPQTWQSLLTTVGVLSSHGIIPIANSPDDSAALIEMIALGLGGEQVLDTVLDNVSLTESDWAQSIWLNAFQMYDELCAYGSFPDAAMTDELAEAIEKMTPVTSESDLDGSAADSYSSMKADAVGLFNSGSAAMIIIDNERLDEITVERFSAVPFPECTEGGRQVLVGGCNIGWYITKRAFSDKSVCDTVISFVDSMTGTQAAEKYSAMGYLTSCDSETDPIGSGICMLAGSADGFASTRRTSVNSVRFHLIEQIAAALSMDIIAPDQAMELLCGSDMELADVVDVPTVSGSDITVSGSDIQMPAQ